MELPRALSATFTFDPTGTADVLQDKALMAIDDNSTARTATAST